MPFQLAFAERWVRMAVMVWVRGVALLTVIAALAWGVPVTAALTHVDTTAQSLAAHHYDGPMQVAAQRALSSSSAVAIGARSSPFLAAEAGSDALPALRPAYGPGAASPNDPAFANFAPGKLATHFGDHGADMGYADKGQYLQGARDFFNSGDTAYYTRPNGDVVHFNQSTNEFGVITPGNVIRTYFGPTRGAAYFLDDYAKYMGVPWTF